MSAVELIALAASISLLVGLAAIPRHFVTGLAMKFGWIALPDQLQALDVLANNWIIGIAGVGAWPSSSPTRLPGSTVRGMQSTRSSDRSAERCSARAIVDSSDPAWQVASFLLGGGAAFVAHAGKPVRALW